MKKLKDKNGEGGDDYKYDEEINKLMNNKKKLNKVGSLDRLGGRRHSDMRQIVGAGNRSSMAGSINRRNARAQSMLR